MTANDKTPQFLKPVRWVSAKGRDIDEMRENLMKDLDGQALFQIGDVKLVWVNEADLIMQDMNIWVYNQNIALGTFDDPEDGI
jgi:hypothetical protein